MKKLFSTLIAGICAITCVFSFVACGSSTDDSGNGGGNTHTKHNWSATYTPDDTRDQHYQTCDGCDEKQYSNHDYGTSGVCVCGKTKPATEHTGHNWSTTYTPDDARDQHYQTCDGCDEKQYSDHDYGTSGVCACGKTKPVTNIPAESVSLDKTNIELVVGGAGTKLTATVLPENATDKKVTYLVEPAGVVSVDNDGNVTVITDGTAVITVTTTNNKTATCNVIVTAPLPTDAEIIAALNSYCLDNLLKRCFVGMTVDKEKVFNGSWYIDTNIDGNITSVEYMFTYNTTEESAVFKIGKVTFADAIKTTGLVDGDIGNTTYTSSYTFSYDSSIQERRAALTNAICDKVFGVTANAIRFIVDKGSYAHDPELTEVGRFTVVQITESEIKEISINIKTSSNDTEYINKLSNSSNYRTYDENSYDISGTKLSV